MPLFPMGVLIAVAAVGVALAASYGLAARWLPDVPMYLRWGGAGIGVIALQAVLFYLLVGFGLFSVGPLLALTVVGGAAVGYGYRRCGELLDRWSQDSSAVVGFVRFAFSGRRRWIGLVVVLLLVAHLLRSLVLPPLAWDSLTYHLVRASLWVKEAGLSDYAAPGSWHDYRHLMPAGDALSAWAMLPVRSDALLPLVWSGVWGLMVLGTYGVARELGARRAHAYVAALVAGFVPAVSRSMFVAYVDNLVAAMELLAAAMFLRAEREREVAPAIFGLAALLVGLAVKKSIIPFLGTGVVLYGYLVWRDHRELWLWAGGAAVGLGGFLVGPPMVYLWVTEGSPVYPWGISIGGWTLFDGWSRGVSTEPSYASVERLANLFWRGFTGKWLSHYGFGLLTPLLFVLGVGGLIQRLRARTLEVSLAVFAGTSALLAWHVIGQLGGYGATQARYIVAAPAFGAAIAAAVDRRWIYWLLVGGLVYQILYFLPLNWGPLDVWVTSIFVFVCLPFVVIGGAVGWYFIREERDQLSVALAMGLVVLTASVGTVLEPIRRLYRYDFYREAARGESYSNHPIIGPRTVSFQSGPIWEKVDQPGRTHRIAVTVGWNGRGLNWYVYPFFGQRLQNDIVYVPVTEDGSPMSLHEKRKRSGEASYEAWHRRLLEQEIDYVAALGEPSPIERQAMEVHRQAFELVQKGFLPANRLYRVKKPAAGKLP